MPVEKMDGATASTSTSPARFNRRHLRTSTVIIPSTGERIRTRVTLRHPKITAQLPIIAMPLASERTPLLQVSDNHDTTNGEDDDDDMVNIPPRGRFGRVKLYIKDAAVQCWTFWTSATGKAIFKCSLAYFLATLATFSNPIARILGTHHDGNQLVANIVVWFDPNRTEGAMEEGTILALFGWVFAACLAFSSMGTAVFFNSHELIAVGHAIILVVFVGGGFGLIAWTKHWFNHPLVNVSCSIVSAGLVTVLTREGAIQAGEMSWYRIIQLLKMLVMAIFISFSVNFLVFPLPARKKLQESFIKCTDALADVLATVTSSFLAGSEEDMTHPLIVTATDKLQSASNSLPSQLVDARFEQYVLGRERQWHLEHKLVKCFQRLSQDMGGLKSAAEVQFALLSDSRSPSQPQLAAAVHANGTNGHVTESSPRVDPDAPERQVPEPESGAHGNDTSTGHAGSAESIFDTFISHLGPPMKSLAFTLKEILLELPYAPDRANTLDQVSKFRSSLTEAIKLFSQKQREALDLVYKSRELTESSTIVVATNFEEVAASCGHFSSCLLDLAEDCVTFLDILEGLDDEIIKRPHGRSWKWMLFWKKQVNENNEIDYPGVSIRGLQASSMSTYIHRFTANTQNMLKEYGVSLKKQPFPYSIWPYLSVFRRDDVRYALKVGAGAAFIAMFAYFPQTRPTYQAWHLDWTLTAYMIVCSMTIGASNTNAWQRIGGTLIGAALAIPVWILCAENPYALAAIGWVISMFCWYFIIARGLAPTFRFTLLTYNLCVLYSYALSIREPDVSGDDEDEDTGAGPEIYNVVKHRIIAISLGIVIGMLITRLVWPLSARKKLRNGLALLWLRMSLMWKKAPLSTLLNPEEKLPGYLDIRQENDLRNFMMTLQEVKASADSEFELHGPFPSKSFDALLEGTNRILDSFHSLNVVMLKNNKATLGETQILKFTESEREQASARVSHLLAVLASSMYIAYPISDTNPNLDDKRAKLLAKVFEFRKGHTGESTVIKDEDYEILYAFALVTSQIVKEIEAASREIEKLYDTVDEGVVSLQ